MIFLLSNIVQNAVIGPDDSVTGGAVGAVTLIVMNAVITRWLAADDRAARWLEGTSSPVIDDGRLIPGTLRHLAIRREEIEHAVRLQNGDGIDDVQSAWLEPSGHLVIVLTPAAQTATRGDLEQIERRLSAMEALLDRRSQ
ncbi:DUF421 domain-containing protein [Streptomyces sp. GESEQ-35]|uniref:DUF421 domain-containing protein n=1 Tax=Streptomyces sp. GESEQ-35 TaxID=2812657 RepID=UPI001B32E773|nr:YetF domain-containing protein [Streptomyces sp. GESEQ-35]